MHACASFLNNVSLPIPSRRIGRLRRRDSRYSSDEVCGTNGLDLIHPDDRESIMQAIQAKLGSSEPVDAKTIEVELNKKLAGNGIEDNRGSDSSTPVDTDQVGANDTVLPPLEYRRKHKDGHYVMLRTKGQCVVRNNHILQEETVLEVSRCSSRTRSGLSAMAPRPPHSRTYLHSAPGIAEDLGLMRPPVALCSHMRSSLRAGILRVGHRLRPHQF